MTQTNSQQPLPGQIWELDRSPKAPLEFSPQDRQRLYPETARRWMAGEGLPRYAIVAQEPERAFAPEEPWAVLWVLLLSPETDRLSDINILIPSAISGMGRDLLALTGRILPMLSCNLSRLVGRRLSPSVCHALLKGDRSDDSNLASMESLGLVVGSSDRRLLPEMQEFYRRESEFAAVLEVPVAAYRTYEKAIAISEVLLDLAFEVETEFLEEESPKPQNPPHPEQLTAIRLSQWLEDIVETGWQKLEELLPKSPETPAFNFRSVTPKSKSNGKLIELGEKPDAVTVALSAELTPISGSEELDITVGVYAIEEHLPPGLQLILLDESGENVSEIIARVADTAIQQDLSGFPGEEFSIKVVLGESSIIEYFEV